MLTLMVPLLSLSSVLKAPVNSKTLARQVMLKLKIYWACDGTIKTARYSVNVRHMASRRTRHPMKLSKSMLPFSSLYRRMINWKSWSLSGNPKGGNKLQMKPNKTFYSTLTCWMWIIWLIDILVFFHIIEKKHIEDFSMPMKTPTQTVIMSVLTTLLTCCFESSRQLIRPNHTRAIGIKSLVNALNLTKTGCSETFMKCKSVGCTRKLINKLMLPSRVIGNVIIPTFEVLNTS